jgi:hypothetical protein
MTPKRIQLSRKRGFKLPENTVVVSRPSKWGNPYSITPQLLKLSGSKIEAQQAVVDAYRDWLCGSAQGNKLLAVIEKELHGKNLACWCAPGTPCHADVLLKLAK